MMNLALISGMIVIVTFAISYGESSRKTKSNQEFLALQKGLLKGCLVSLGLLVLPIFGSLAFPKVQPNLSAVIFVLELVGIILYSHVELRRLNYRKVKLSCLLTLLVGIALIWCQLFSYYQMDRDFFGNLKFIMATVPTWLLAVILTIFTYLDGPKLRAKKKSKAEVENAKLREQIERMQNQQNQLQQDNEKLEKALRAKVTPEPKLESVTEDKKAESNLPKNTQAEEESTTKVEEAQTTTSAPKSDAEEKPKLEVTNPSMTGVQQQKLSEILNRLAGDPSPEAQQAAIEEIVKNYRSATAKEAPAPEEETSSQEPEVVDFEEESDEEEEEILDPVDDEDWEDGTILTDLLAKINPVTIVLVVAIIFVIYAIARVVF
jgi:membrane protein